MRFFDFVSVKLTLCLILGILIGYYFEPGILFIGSLLIAFSTLLVLVWKNQKISPTSLFGMVIFATTLLLGIFIISIGLPKNQPHHFQKTGEASTQLKLKITQILKSNSYSFRYFANVETIGKSKASGQVILYVSKDSLVKELGVDDEILTYSALEPILSPWNPYQFNFKDYLKKQGVYHQLRITTNQYVLLKNPTKTLVGMASNFRAGLIKKLQKQGFGKEELGVIQALLLGKRDDISEETYANYVNAGAVHILAVSGLHVGILLLLLQFLLQPLEQFRNGKMIKLVVIVVLLWSYAFITGLSPSIVRAVTMFSFLAYAMYLNRPTSSFNIVALSMFFILLIKPLFLFQVGFQMSYAAVFSIIWMYPKLQQFWTPQNGIIEKIWQLLSVSIAAQLGVLPLSLFHFHQFPALFFVSNLIVVPFLGMILGLGILVLGLTYFNVLPQFLASLYDGLIGGMNTVIRWVAQQEAFIFTDIIFDAIQLVLGYVAVLVLTIAFPKFNFRNLILLLISFIVYSGYLVFDVWAKGNEENVWLLHQTKNSVLLHQKGKVLNAISHDFTQIERRTKSLKIAKRITAVSYDSLQNHYIFKGKRLFVLDGSNIYGTIKAPDYVLLSQSPKVHLERFIDSVQPKMILVDGSNYKSDVERWKQTCGRRKLPFHYTGEKGAYKFSVQD